jgi:hypothetical protein
MKFMRTGLGGREHERQKTTLHSIYLSLSPASSNLIIMLSCYFRAYSIYYIPQRSGGESNTHARTHAICIGLHKGWNYLGILGFPLCDAITTASPQRCWKGVFLRNKTSTYILFMHARIGRSMRRIGTAAVSSS